MKINFKSILPHIIAIVLFCIGSLIYFYPVMQGKKMLQSDIVQYTGMAKQQNDFRAETGEEPFYTDSAFIGMPTYQLGANYPHHYIKQLDRALRFLPRPADYLFLYLISFYVLMLVLRAEPKFAFLGAIAFGLSTYYIIILGVGHNAKAHAIAYFPLVLAGILLVFQRKYIIGFLLSCIALGLQIAANHFQMTYYLLLLVIVLGIVYLVDAYKKNELNHFFKSVGILSVAAVFSLFLNASNLLATQQYAKESIRGKSDITITPDGRIKEDNQGLSYDYITEYSYGKLETLDLLIPGFMGGSGNKEEFDKKESKFIRNLSSYNPNDAQLIYAYSRMYWGDQPIVAAPAYLGAVIIFLFVLALFLVKGRFRVWVVAGIILTLLLSWGKNFSVLTDFFIDYVPLYNKFRAVSSIQVIIEFVVPMMAIIGLIRFVSKIEQKEAKLKALKFTTIIVGGLCVFLLLFGTSIFDFVSAYDAFKDSPEIMEPLIADRKAYFIDDTIRTLVFILLTAGALFFYLKGKLKENILLVIVGVIIIIDLVGVNTRYVNASNFVQARKVDMPFQASPADQEIIKDTSRYRVYDKLQTMSGKPSYYHNAIGGYSAVKPRRFQEIYDFYLNESDSINANNRKAIPSILNMLNVKYLIDANSGREVALTNPYANGNAWFVEKVYPVATANDELMKLKEINTKTDALINKNEFTGFKQTYKLDSLASITLKAHKPNKLEYVSNNANDGLAIFSEMYYNNGWKAFIDGKEVSHMRANYLLRALPIPAGKHNITFQFDPEVVKRGSLITLISSLLLFVLIICGIYFEFFRKKSHE